MTPQAEVLIRMVHYSSWSLGVELGVLKGETFFALLNACPGLCMTGVDIWRQQPEKDEQRDAGGRSYHRYDMADCWREVTDRAGGYNGRAQLIRMDTVEAAGLFPDGQFDFVFVDADHLYEAVKADIAAWRPKVKPGGMLLGHDYQADFPGVVQAVNEVFGEPMQFKATVWGVQL